MQVEFNDFVKFGDVEFFCVLCVIQEGVQDVKNYVCECLFVECVF